jgi:tRNA threonylcarbamoyladenosine biosynthesis protein TsaB
MSTSTGTSSTGSGRFSTEMKILAIDTATSCGVIGLSENDRPVAEVSVVSKETHSARLLPSIDWLLRTVGWSLGEIDGFGVTLGPGSFTGLRVGLATIKGFAWSLKKPVAGLHTLTVLGSQYRAESKVIVPMLDARRDRVYGAAFRWDRGGLKTLFPPSDLPAAELVSNLSEPIVCLGEGARKYRSAIEQSGRKDVEFAPLEYDLPRGGTIARLAFEALSKGETLDIYKAEPAYMRASEAELKRKEADSAL